MSYIIKIGIIGDCNVGKTSIINTYINNNQIIDVTLGVDFKYKIKTFENTEFKLHIWDTSGQEKFKSIVSSYYRDLDVVLFVFDSTDILTFNNIKYWLQDFEKFNKKKNIKFLIGSKTDKKNLVITHNFAQQFAKNNNMHFFQTSIIIKKTIDLLFDNIIEIVYNKLIYKEIYLKSYTKYASLSIIDNFKNKNFKNKNKCCLIQ